MAAVITLIMVLAVSLLVTRVATIALSLTGLSRQTARFQARSALTGVGFTTAESEKIVNHPVRRRILMLLMLLGNAGIVTVIASAILTFVNASQAQNWLLRGTVLVAAVAGLLTVAQSQWVDRHLSGFIRLLLRRWTDIELRDYASLMHLGGEYQITELQVQEGDWLAGRTLEELRLPEEGVIVLGIEEPSGEYSGTPIPTTPIEPGQTLLLYGRARSLEKLDTRRAGVGGELAHGEAIAEQRQVELAEARKQEERQQEEPKQEGPPAEASEPQDRPASE